MRIAKPRPEPIDIRATYRDTLKRFPKTMALLAGIALTGCAPHPRYVSTYCLTQAQFNELKASQPPKVRDQLTGDAAKDVGILAGSAIRLRAHDDGLLEVLGGCVDPNKSN